jgi:hypothetical protein
MQGMFMTKTKKAAALLLEIKSLHAKLDELVEAYVDEHVKDSPGVPRAAIANAILPRGACRCEIASILLEKKA